MPRMTPKDIRNQDFPKSVRGYSPKEVVRFLEQIAEEWEACEKLTEKIKVETESLKQEVTRLNAREGEVQNILGQARREAEQIRSDAKRQASQYFDEVEGKATAIKDQTETWLAELLEEIEVTQQRRDNFLLAFRSALDSHYEILEKESNEPISLTSRLQEFLKSRHGSKPTDGTSGTLTT